MINIFLIISYFYHIWWKRQVHLDNQVYRNKLHYGWAHYTRHSDHKCQVDMDLHIFGQYMPNFGYIQNWQDIRVGSLVDLQCNQVSMNRCIGCLFLESHCIGHMDLGYMGRLLLVQLKNELQLLSIWEDHIENSYFVQKTRDHFSHFSDFDPPPFFGGTTFHKIN